MIYHLKPRWLGDVAILHCINETCCAALHVPRPEPWAGVSVEAALACIAEHGWNVEVSGDPGTLLCPKHSRKPA